MTEQYRPMWAHATEQSTPVESITPRADQVGDVRAVESLALLHERLGPDHLLHRAQPNRHPEYLGIHGVLEDQGYPMARLHDIATARMPTRAEKAALRLAAGVPVIDLLHVSLRADGQPYEATRFVMRADMSALVYDVPVE